MTDFNVHQRVVRFSLQNFPRRQLCVDHNLLSKLDLEIRIRTDLILRTLI